MILLVLELSNNVKKFMRIEANSLLGISIVSKSPNSYHQKLKKNLKILRSKLPEYMLSDF